MHPDLATWMEETGYGRVLSRRGMPARERERVAVAVLAAQGPIPVGLTPARGPS